MTSLALILVLAFVAASALAFWMLDALFPNLARRRLSDMVEHDGVAPRHVARNRMVAWLARITEPVSRFATPEGTELTEVSMRLIHAGLRQKSAPAAFFGVKACLTLLLPLLTVLYIGLSGTGLGELGLFSVLIPACVGYYLPSLALRWRIRRRKQQIFEAMPDAIDLLTVCIEAGLGMESAMARVSEDLAMSSPVLAEELKLIGLEVRAGMNRELALRNFYARTGVDEVDSFVTMVLQAERFGTSMAQALRVHSDMMRTRRRHQVEEQAAKVPTKLLFPLILCIFPLLFFVLVGPVAIQLFQLVYQK